MVKNVLADFPFNVLSIPTIPRKYSDYTYNYPEWATFDQSDYVSTNPILNINSVNKDKIIYAIEANQYTKDDIDIEVDNNILKINGRHEISKRILRVNIDLKGHTLGDVELKYGILFVPLNKIPEETVKKTKINIK